MKRLHHAILSIVIIVCILSAAIACAQELKPIRLPAPQTEGGKPLMQALKERQSSRAFSPRELPPQVLSNLLWAAFGINRPESGRRTAPSAMNWQEIDIYVTSSQGLYLYVAKDHTLQPVLAQDLRALTGTQDFVKNAPINLVYVADFSRMGNAPDDDKEVDASADTGFIGQNVYLFCASEGLATVVRGLIDKPPLEKAMGLRPDQRVILAQTVGYPKE